MNTDSHITTYPPFRPARPRAGKYGRFPTVITPFSGITSLVSIEFPPLSGGDTLTISIVFRYDIHRFPMESVTRDRFLRPVAGDFPPTRFGCRVGRVTPTPTVNGRCPLAFPPFRGETCPAEVPQHFAASTRRPLIGLLPGHIRGQCASPGYPGEAVSPLPARIGGPPHTPSPRPGFPPHPPFARRTEGSPGGCGGGGGRCGGIRSARPPPLLPV